MSNMERSTLKTFGRIRNRNPITRLYPGDAIGGWDFGVEYLVFAGGDGGRIKTS